MFVDFARIMWLIWRRDTVSFEDFCGVIGEFSSFEPSDSGFQTYLFNCWQPQDKVTKHVAGYGGYHHSVLGRSGHLHAKMEDDVHIASTPAAGFRTRMNRTSWL